MLVTCANTFLLLLSILQHKGQTLKLFFEPLRGVRDCSGFRIRSVGLAHKLETANFAVRSITEVLKKLPVVDESASSRLL